jgi:hypothetical protein
MVSNGLLDNRIEKPPEFEEGGRVAVENKINLERENHKSRRMMRKSNNSSRDESKKLLP